MPAEAVNVADVAPAGTDTELGDSERRVLLLDNETAVPPAVAGPFKVTLHTEDAPEFKVLGLHASEDTVTTCAKAKSAEENMAKAVIVK